MVKIEIPLRSKVRVNVWTEMGWAIPSLKRQVSISNANELQWQGLPFVFNQSLLPDDILVVWHYPDLSLMLKNNLLCVPGYGLNYYQQWRNYFLLRSIAQGKRKGHHKFFPFIPHAKNRMIQIETESPESKSVRFYRSRSTNQFGIVLSPYPKPEFYRGHWLPSHGGLNWFYGIELHYNFFKPVVINKNWNQLLLSPQKTKGISVITSTLNYASRYQRRNHFISKLQQAYTKNHSEKNLLDIFGLGRKTLLDKATGLEPYRYHIALENSQINDYWTEKLADALLAECFVFYAGAPNIQKYFSMGNIEPIDISNPDAAIQKIQLMVKENIYHSDKAQKAIKANKRHLMQVENFFALIYRVAKTYRLLS